MKKTLFALVALALGSGACASINGADDAAKVAEWGQSKAVTNVGFETPESVLYDTAMDIYLVSNINGDPTDRDDDGFISRLLPDGTVENLKWIDGADAEVILNAPKGLALVGEVLYVADIDHVRMFHRNTGESLGEIPVLGSTFLNDVVADGDGGVLVSDSGLNPDFSSSGTDTIYSISEHGVVRPLVEGVELARPNGLAVAQGMVWNVSFGSKEVRKLDRSGSLLESYQAPEGSLDGVEVLQDGTVLISSWGAKSVYRLNQDGTFETVVSDVEAAADIGVDTRRNRILIPLFKKNAVHFEPLS